MFPASIIASFCCLLKLMHVICITEQTNKQHTILFTVLCGYNLRIGTEISDELVKTSKPFVKK